MLLGHAPCWQVLASRPQGPGRPRCERPQAPPHRPPQPRADLIRKHPFLLICSGRSPRTPGENRCSLSPDEHLGLGKWLHSALFRREKRILWLQTTLSVNILQLSARLSDDKPHAARRAANLRPYGYHFIVIFHGRNVNGRCLPQPSLTAPLSTLKRLPPRGRDDGACVQPPLQGAKLRPGLPPARLGPGHQLLPSGQAALGWGGSRWGPQGSQPQGHWRPAGWARPRRGCRDLRWPPRLHQPLFPASPPPTWPGLGARGVGGGGPGRAPGQESGLHPPRQLPRGGHGLQAEASEVCRPGALAGWAWPLGSGLAEQVTGVLSPDMGGPGGAAGSRGHVNGAVPWGSSVVSGDGSLRGGLEHS